MTKTSRERIDDDAARELLDQRHGELNGNVSDEFDIALHWAIQMRLIKDTKPERGHRLAELHFTTTTNPENKAAQDEREKLLEEIADEALAEVEEKQEQIARGERKDYFNL
jgi:hypothetical protein